MINEPNIEGTCSIKDVGVDTIQTFTQSLEEDSKNSSDDSDDSDNNPIYDNIYSTSNSESSYVNDENLSIDLVTIEP